MKKVMIVAGFALSLFSCKKNEKCHTCIVTKQIVSKTITFGSRDTVVNCGNDAEFERFLEENRKTVSTPDSLNASNVEGCY